MSQAHPSNDLTEVSKRPSRRKRAAVVLLIAAVTLIGAGLFVASRPWFILAVIEPGLERMLGGDIEIDDARWTAIGKMELSGVSVRVANHAGLPEPAGEVASIGRVTVEVNLLPLLIGRVSAKAMSFDDGVLRLAEDVHDAGQFAFFGLDPRIDMKGRRGARPPRIEVTNLTLESGEYDDVRYTPIGRRHVAGTMLPMVDDETTFTFNLVEVDNRGQALTDGLYIHGRWDTVTLSHQARIDGLVLDDRTFAMCPQIVRLWWRHMGLTGRVSEAKLDWTIGERFTVELAIEQVDLTLPEQVDAFLVRYHEGRIIEQTDRPRMELHSGRIRWADNGFELADLEGRFLSGDMSEDEVVHLPYRISVEITDLPVLELESRGEWLTHALEVAPFHMQIETSMDVTQPHIPAAAIPSSARAVDLPLPVARVFEQLHLADWSIDTRVEVSRDAATVLDTGALVAAPIRWRGDLNINSGSLRVERFPYRLDGVEASLKIEQNLIRIQEFHASGSEDARFTLHGEIILPPDDPGAPNELGYDVHVEVTHLPLDEAFFSALPERNHGFFNSLFSRQLYESFEQAGLVGDAAHPASELDERLTELELMLAHREHEPRDDEETAQQRVDTAVGPPDPAILRERDRLIAKLERGPIRLAGNVHLNLRMRREVGPDQPDLLTGTIEPDVVSIVYDRFPYPFTVIRGRLHWSPDRISIIKDEQTDGLSIILPGGGRGTITGGLDRPRIDGVRRIQSDLHFEVDGEPMNELLAAAIPLTDHDREHLPDAESWPGTVFAAPARLLRGIGLQGAISTTGHISTSFDPPSGTTGNLWESSADDTEPPLPRTSYHFDIRLTHGSAEPTAELAEHIGAAGLFWPDGFSIHNVQGQLIVAEDSIDLTGFHGWHDSNRERQANARGSSAREIFATGKIDRIAQPTTIALDVVLSDLEMHESMINLVPAEGIEIARDLWDRYEPHGSFTAELQFEETGDYRHPIKLKVEPDVCHIMIDDSPVSFTGLSGRVVITGGEEPLVEFEHLKLNVHKGVIDHGDLTIDGAYGVTAGTNPLHVKGQWTNAAIESPVIPEMMRLIGAEQHRRWYADHRPRGRVDAAFEYESAHGFHNTVRDEFHEESRTPRPEGVDRSARYWLSAKPHRLEFMLRDTLIQAEFDPASSALLTPGHLLLTDFAGRVGESTFRVDGDVAFGGTIDASLDVDFHGHVASDEVMALFPEPARNVLALLEFDDGGMTQVERSRLLLYGTLREDAELTLASDPDPEIPPGSTSHPSTRYDWEVTYNGRLQMNGASMQLGVPVTEIDGALNLNLRLIPDAPPQLDMSASFDSVRVIDRLITDLHADVIRLSDDGAIMVIPEIRGESYGGIVLAEATIGMGQQDRYEFKVELAGLSLSDLYADHSDRLAASNGEARKARPRKPRGEVFGGVQLAGQHGRPETRSGRGMIRAVGGNLENIPMLLQLFHVLQMTIPLRGSLDQANAEFYIDGDRVIFEQILFESTIAEQFAVFQLIGRGQMDLNTYELNTQFRSRSGMLLVRDLAGGLGDQLYVIEVKGTPANPKARVLPLPWLLQPFNQTPYIGKTTTDQ